MITIQTVKAEDLKEVLALEQLVFNAGSYPAFVIRQLFDISNSLFIVAKENNKILGFAVGALNTNNQKAWVLSLGVHPEARGKQIGKKLTNKLVNLLKDENCLEICLTVHPDNAAAINIYKELGFKGETIIEDYFLENEKRIIMTLKNS
jgi:ribosomal-protein-alanine N-acetyltransferase